ncbi:flavodoxin [Thiospirochaeta perfilievii]|uniref:Flavodoxin n=1 Tax=Thiospirochaeta perfilievii TaxID=252967 RepID=A0A5C1QA61_9SPIO|nr:flavodoxin [Thiospirochaeta perfilievii]QEN04367.1 flavodoxin [Thiospirochaeta perfilievii]
MTQLIIYYSYEGNTEFMATKMAQSVGADLMKLKPLNEKKFTGFMKYVWGGRAAVMRQKPKLGDLSHNIEEYNRIILCTPVWAGTFTPPFNTLLHSYDLKNREIGLFCCNAGGMGKVFTNFKRLLSGSKIIGELGILDPLKSDREKKVEQAVNWVKSL